MHWIFTLVIIFIIAKLLVQLALECLNCMEARIQKNLLPQNLMGVVTPEAHARSAEYTLEHNHLGMVETVWAVIIKLIILCSGVLPYFYNSVIGAWGVGNAWAASLMMAIFSVLVGILFWPFEWVSVFGIEAKYGFNRQTPRLWLTDTLKGIVVQLLLTVPLTAALLWMAGGALQQWWLWAFLVVLAFEVALNWVYPNFIEPLFNKFEPLKEGALKTRLEDLAKRANVSVKKILVMDASKRSSHANAYFAGIGSSRRIVLYDTLLQQLTDEEVEAVLAHEIGHMKHQHTLRGMYVSGALQLIGFCLVSLVILWPDFYTAFGFMKAAGVAGAFWALSFVTGAFSFWLSPVISGWYRKHEYEADAMASELVGSPAPLISGLKKMTKESLSSIEDHPLSHAFYAGHPTLKERESALLSKVSK